MGRATNCGSGFHLTANGDVRLGIQDGAFREARSDKGRRTFPVKHGRKRVAIPLVDCDDDLALAILIASKTTVSAMLLHVGWFHIAAKIAAINFRILTFAVNYAFSQFLCHCLT
jgi:hypothetical protein